MHWLDVAGPPGSGKSTLCDAFWGPHALPIRDDLPPQGWQAFIDEIGRLFGVIEAHPSFDAAIRMVNRSVRKIATVARTGGSWPYIQTALVQRGLGFGWRIADMGGDLDGLRAYFELMPVSLGVVFTKCDAKIVEQRNAERETVAATAHENRAFMAPLMAPAIELAKEVLDARGVAVREISTEQPIAEARRALVAFAAERLTAAPELPHQAKNAFSSLPSWWR